MSNQIEVGNIKPRKRIISDGIQTVYYFDFTIFNVQDLNIYFNNILQVQGYSIILKPDIKGGSIIFTTAPKTGVIITIFRNLPLKRTTNFKEVGPFMSSKVNYEFDYQLACIEQVEETISRTVTFPPYAPTQLNVTLPLPQAGKAIIWGEEENSLENSAFKLQDLDKHILDTLNASETNLKILAQNQEYLTEIRTTKEDLSDIKPYIDNHLDEKLNIDTFNLTIEGKQNIVNIGLPDYSKGISKPWGIEHTAEVSGYVFWQATSNNTTPVEATVNGTKIPVCNIANAGVLSGNFPITKNEKWKVYGGNANYLIIFYPFKGVA